MRRPIAIALLALCTLASQATAQARIPVNAGDRVRVFRASTAPDWTVGVVSDQTAQDLLLRQPFNDLLSVPVADIARVDVKRGATTGSRVRGLAIGAVAGAAVGLAVHLLADRSYGGAPDGSVVKPTLEKPKLTGRALPFIAGGMGAAIGIAIGGSHWIRVYPGHG
jgi:hypothetical protein